MTLVAILLNPTIDQIYEIENFTVGGTFKVKKSTIFPVGKAISFSLSVRKLNREKGLIKVIGLIGYKEISLYSDFLSKRNIEFEFVKVKDKTRSNKTINDPIKGTTTHIREEGFKIDKQDLEKLINLITSHTNEQDYIVFSGSIPPGVEDDFYYNLINNCKRKKNAITILDTNGRALIEGIKSHPMIIKPNLVELSQILNKPELIDLDFSDYNEFCRIICKEAFFLLNEDLKIILITLGNKGAILLTVDIILYGKISVNNIVDTVGAGDSFLAGFVLSYYQKKDLNECFKCALACGAANTLVSGPGIFKIKDFKKLLKETEIFKINFHLRQ